MPSFDSIRVVTIDKIRISELRLDHKLGDFYVRQQKQPGFWIRYMPASNSTHALTIGKKPGL